MLATINRKETLKSYLIKNILQLILGQGGTFDVFHGTQILGHTVTIFLANGLHLLTGELLANTGVIAQIGLGADDQAGNTGAMVMHLGEPFFANVFEGCGGSHGKADQEDIGLGVRQRTKTIVILLTSSIKQAQRVGFVTDPDFESDLLLTPQVSLSHLHDSNRIIIENRGDVFGGKLVCCVGDEQTCFSHGTVSNHDTPKEFLVSRWNRWKRQKEAGN